MVEVEPRVGCGALDGRVRRRGPARFTGDGCRSKLAEGIGRARDPPLELRLLLGREARQRGLDLGEQAEVLAGGTGAVVASGEPRVPEQRPRAVDERGAVVDQARVEISLDQRLRGIARRRRVGVGRRVGVRVGWRVGVGVGRRAERDGARRGAAVVGLVGFGDELRVVGAREQAVCPSGRGAPSVSATEAVREWCFFSFPTASSPDRATSEGPSTASVET